MDYNELVCSLGSHLTDTGSLLFLDLSGECTLDCIYCYRKNLPAEQKRPVSEPIFSKLKQLVPSCKAVTLGFLGEPTLSDHFCDFVNYCAQLRKPLKVFTNGASFDDDLIRFLSDKQLHVVFSLDSLQAETYARYRPGGDLRKILGITELFSHSVWPKVELSVCIDQNNYSHLRDILTYCHNNDIRLVYVNYREIFQPADYQDALLHCWDDWCREKEHLQTLSSRLGITCLFPDDTRGNDGRGCASIFPYIDAQGTVYPCCHGTGFPLGSLQHESFENIWQSERSRLFRERVKNKDLPPMCKYCSAALGPDKRRPLVFFKNRTWLYQALSSLSSSWRNRDLLRLRRDLSLLQTILPAHKAIVYYGKKLREAENSNALAPDN